MITEIFFLNLLAGNKYGQEIAVEEIKKINWCPGLQRIFIEAKVNQSIRDRLDGGELVAMSTGAVMKEDNLVTRAKAGSYDCAALGSLNCERWEQLRDLRRWLVSRTAHWL